MKEGQGKLVERMYRSVRASAIPGGSEEILLDFTIRQVRCAPVCVLCVCASVDFGCRHVCTRVAVLLILMC